MAHPRDDAAAPRLDHLERAARRWKWIALAIGIGAVALLCGDPRGLNTIRAQRREEAGAPEAGARMVRFGKYYINTALITKVIVDREGSGGPDGGELRVATAGNDTYITLTGHDATGMRSWLESVSRNGNVTGPAISAPGSVSTGIDGAGKTTESTKTTVVPETGVTGKITIVPEKTTSTPETAVKSKP